MTPEFWAGKRVFITGHTGFKGSWLCLWLQQLGAEVTGFALAPPTNPSLFELARVGEGMASVEGDIRDLQSLTIAVQAARPEVVIHMAAQSLVRKSYAEPVETYATNVMGTVNLLEAVRRDPGIRAVVVVTTDKCYDNREWVWGYRENDPMGGADPYSSSKGCAELVTAAYRSSFFANSDGVPVGIATVRAGNVIGGGDWALDRLVPDMIRAFAAGQRVSIRNPGAIRPWQHVLEPLAGYLELARRLFEGHPGMAEAWNFGADDSDSRPVRWIVERLVEGWGPGASWQLDETGQHPHEAGYLKLDCSKARQQLDWRPHIRLAEALEWIVEWHKGQLSGEDARALTEAQIVRYQQRLMANR